MIEKGHHLSTIEFQRFFNINRKYLDLFLNHPSVVEIPQYQLPLLQELEIIP